MWFAITITLRGALSVHRPMQYHFHYSGRNTELRSIPIPACFYLSRVCALDSMSCHQLTRRPGTDLIWHSRPTIIRQVEKKLTKDEYHAKYLYSYKTDELLPGIYGCPFVISVFCYFKYQFYVIRLAVPC